MEARIWFVLLECLHEDVQLVIAYQSVAPLQAMSLHGSPKHHVANAKDTGEFTEINVTAIVCNSLSEEVEANGLLRSSSLTILEFHYKFRNTNPLLFTIE